MASRLPCGQSSSGLRQQNKTPPLPDPILQQTGNSVKSRPFSEKLGFVVAFPTEYVSNELSTPQRLPAVTIESESRQQLLEACPGLQLEHLFTHFGGCEPPEDTVQQIGLLVQVSKGNKRLGVKAQPSIVGLCEAGNEELEMRIRLEYQYLAWSRGLCSPPWGSSLAIWSATQSDS